MSNLENKINEQTKQKQTHCGECGSEVSPQSLMRLILPRYDLLGEKRLDNLSEKSPKHLFPWVFIEFSLHRDAYQRKEIRFTDNITRITRVLLSQGLVEKVTPIGHKTKGDKLILCLDPKHLVCIT